MMMIVALLAALGQDPVDPQQVVAVILGRKITAGEIGLKTRLDPVPPPAEKCGPDDPVSKLQDLVWQDAARRYIDTKELKATSEELKEMADFIRKSEEEGRRRRAGEIEEVEKKLQSADLAGEERRTLETRAKTLRALAENDRWQADHPEEARKILEGVHRPWVEGAKMDAALYREFGGVVAITKFGQVPVGARSALLRRHAKEGTLEIADPSLERRFWASWDVPPRWVAAPDKVDLTPFWKAKR